MEKRYCALTFDDGPNSKTTMAVLDVLERQGVKATFFLVGDNINEASAASVRRAAALGCEFGNHSRTHTAMTTLSDAEICAEINETSEKIKQLTGTEPKYFRAPYLAMEDRMFALIEQVFICGYGCEDWLPEVDAAERARRLLAQACDGAIFLLHDSLGNEQTVEALEQVVVALRAQGYEFQTLTELFAQYGIEPERGTTLPERKAYWRATQTERYLFCAQNK